MSKPTGLCFHATAKALATSLAPLVAVSTRKPTIDVLKYLRFTATGAKVVARATDLIVDITIELDATATQPGEALIDGRRLHGLLSGLDDAELVTLTAIKDGQIRVETAGHTSTLQAPPVAEFPFTKTPLDGAPTVISAGLLATLFKQAQISIPSTDYQSAPSALWLTVTGARIFAKSTDGHRGTIASAPAATVEGITALGMVPRHALNAITSVFPADADVEIRRQNGDIEFVSGLRRCIVKDTDANAPALDRVVTLGEKGTVIEFDRHAAIGAIRRCLVISAAEGQSETLAVRLSFEGATMTAKAAKAQVGESENRVPLLVTAADLESHGFNGRYLLDCLNAITSDRVRMRIPVGKVGSGPAMVQQAEGEPTDYLCVVMPMRS